MATRLETSFIKKLCQSKVLLRLE